MPWYEEERVQVSYLTLRKMVGILGMLLPVVLPVGCILLGEGEGIRRSISVYYDTAMRDIYVGIIFTVGWFFFSYRGYERQDNVAAYLACAFSLGVALFPSVSPSVAVRAIHYASAGSLFLVLAYFSLVLFTKSEDSPTPRKRIRNRIYTACGIVMLVCVVLISIYRMFLTETPIANLHPAFWLEAIALWAFGISWLVKGETVWTDVATEE